MRKLTIALFALILTVCLTASAFALTKSTTMTVEANVVIPALISTTNMNFGNTDGTTNNQASATISVTVEADLPYGVSLDAGQNLINTWRSMVNAGGEYVNYGLWQGVPGGSTECGDVDYANTYQWGSSIPGVGTGANQDITIYGHTFLHTGLTSGAYTDTVLVTVNY